jgi:hypothetical protein
VELHGMPLEQEKPISRCDKCGCGMTKAQGGEIFTVCDSCWGEDW